MASELPLSVLIWGFGKLDNRILNEYFKFCNQSSDQEFKRYYFFSLFNLSLIFSLFNNMLICALNHFELACKSPYSGITNLFLFGKSFDSIINQF